MTDAVSARTSQRPVEIRLLKQESAVEENALAHRSQRRLGIQTPHGLELTISFVKQKGKHEFHLSKGKPSNSNPPIMKELTIYLLKSHRMK